MSQATTIRSLTTALVVCLATQACRAQDNSPPQLAKSETRSTLSPAELVFKSDPSLPAARRGDRQISSTKPAAVALQIPARAEKLAGTCSFRVYKPSPTRYDFTVYATPYYVVYAWNNGDTLKEQTTLHTTRDSAKASLPENTYEFSSIQYFPAGVPVPRTIAAAKKSN